MVAQISPARDTMYFNHGIVNNREVTEDFAGHTTEYTYDGRGNVLTKRYPLENESCQYTYDSVDNVVQTTAPDNTEKRSTWDNRGNEISTTDERGYTISRSYTASGLLESETDTLQRLTQYRYDSKGNLLRVVKRSRGAADSVVIEQKTYDTYGNVVTEHDAVGNLTRYFYDSQGRMTTKTDPLGRRTEYRLDSRGNTLREVNPKGDSTCYVYDVNNNQTAVINTFGDTIVKSRYNAINKVISQTDARGNTTRFEYDLFGQLSKTINPDGTFIEKTYDSKGNVIQSKDELQRQTVYTYDHENRLVRTTFSDGSYIRSVYDASGRRVESYDSRQNRTAYGYDAAGNNTAVTDALNNTTVFEYDEVNRRTALIDALNQRTEYHYDQFDRLVKTVYPGGTFDSTIYDRAGRKITAIDQQSRMTRFVYDSVGNLTTVIEPGNHRTRYTYDGNNNRISQTDANDHTTTMTYDRLNRLTAKTYPNGQQERYHYDVAGNMTAKVAGSDSTSYSYNSRNREMLRRYSSGHTLETQYTDDGKRERIIDYRGTTEYTYDNRGRQIQELHPDGSSIQSSFDSQGNRLTQTTPWAVTRYTYDHLNRPDTVVAANGDRTVYRYNAVGNRDSTIYATGVSVGYRYDSQNRLTALINYGTAGSILSSYAYTLNNAGLRTAVSENTGATVSYSYDSVGNRLSKTHNGVTTSYTYNSRDQLITESCGISTITYIYDNAGRLSQKSDSSGTTTYAWVDNDRMASVSGPSGVFSYQYDAEGRRVQESDGSSVKNYLIDAQLPYGQVVAEYANDGYLTAAYTYGLERISQDRGGTVSYYVADGQGSVRLLTNTAGTVTDTYDYYAFGELLDRTGTTENSFTYTGEQFDPNAGFYYLRARWYDPNKGRFTSVDPWNGETTTPISLHRYLYANINPVSYCDPTGKETILSLMAAISVYTLLATVAVSAADPFSVSRSNKDNFAVFQKDGGINSLGAVEGSLFWVESRWRDIYRYNLRLFTRKADKSMVTKYSAFSGGDQGTSSIPSNYGGIDYYVKLKIWSHLLDYNEYSIGSGIQKIPDNPNFAAWGTIRARINDTPGESDQSWYFHDPYDKYRSTHGCIGTPLSFMDRLYSYALMSGSAQKFHLIVISGSIGMESLK
ncbi:MAG: RHS repeat protein [Chitinivibrionales bacterium]|nr:RHS repeat protein [Chitinivibrionales bacterium]